MNDLVTHPTWLDLDNYAVDIVRQIKVHGWSSIDFVIGLTRGGLIPAVRISHLLDIPMIAINYSSTRGKGDNRNHANALPAIMGELLSGTGELPKQPELLIVDDICDSGYTMEETSTYYAQQGHRVWTAALHYKESAVHKPDFFANLIPADAPWVIYPFEVEN